jgi:hypothetical protein
MTDSSKPFASPAPSQPPNSTAVFMQLETFKEGPKKRGRKPTKASSLPKEASQSLRVRLTPEEDLIAVRLANRNALSWGTVTAKKYWAIVA